MKKYNKEIVTSYEKDIDGENFEVLVLDDGDYYNVHVISERYRDDDEMNTLISQEPKECVNKDYFTTQYLIGELMNYFIWDRVYGESMENDFSAYVTIEQI